VRAERDDELERDGINDLDVGIEASAEQMWVRAKGWDVGLKSVKHTKVMNPGSCRLLSKYRLWEH
jgi:hypothetical protein